ncbi:MAG: NAD-binding protein [Promethearchaeota archaeon]
MSLYAFMIDLRLKLKHVRAAFILLFLVWLTGFIFYAINEPIREFEQIFWVSVSIRPSDLTSDFSGFYQLIWPILVEVIIFSVLIQEFFERFNPVATCKFIALRQKGHTVVIGHGHFGERVVEYLRSQKLPYSVMEKEIERVQELINAEEPVVVGDYTEIENLKFAGVSECKEVFLVSNDIREAIVCAEKVRSLNDECLIYVRVFGDQFQKYFKENFHNVYPFSTMNLAMQSIKKWTANKTGKVLVLGDNHLTQLIAEHVVSTEQREVEVLKETWDEIMEDIMESGQKSSSLTEHGSFLDYLEAKYNFTEFTQILITWHDVDTASDAIMLSDEIRRNYPGVELFVRMFDEELAKILKKFNATSFSTSSDAFDMLQKDVEKNSAIYTE